MNQITIDNPSSQLSLGKGLSVLKSDTVQIILFVFIATFFYSKSEEYRAFRLVYSAFLYLSLWKLLVFYNQSPRLDIKIPRFFKAYLVFLFAFIIYNFSFDYKNPSFNIITLINNPYGFLACLNIFAFGLGATTKKLDGFFSIVLFVSFIFVIFCFVPDFPKFNGFHGYICSYSIVPLFILARHYEKYKWYSMVLLVLACFFSISTDYRIIMLRMLIFLFLYFTLTLVKRSNFLKLSILAIVGFAVYQFIANLPDILNFFAHHVKMENFETDTRTFLYRELMQDLSPSELLRGKGFSGTYFSNYFLNRIDEVSALNISWDRFTIEVGFLQLMLKGGYLYYIIFIIPLVLTVIKNLFSVNIRPLPFAIAIYILSELLLMFFENIPNYGFNYFNLFFLAGFAFNYHNTNKATIANGVTASFK